MEPGSVTDGELAAFLAQEAGRMLLILQHSKQLAGKELGDEGDRIANDFLMGMLRMRRPKDPILSEEERDSKGRLASSRVWIIDPLDGTREFSEGRSDWAVHVALAIDGKAEIGAVALPGLDQLLRSDLPIWVPDSKNAPRLVVSRTRPASEALIVAESIGAELLPMGSAGAKAMAVVRGEADIYLHTGGQYQWDNCAPVAVAQAHGLHCSRVDGSPILYNEAETSLPDLLICRPEWTKRVLELIN
jgi:3'(2'), 5'-bisphosphate nucleotidase